MRRFATEIWADVNETNCIYDKKYEGTVHKNNLKVRPVGPLSHRLMSPHEDRLPSRRPRNTHTGPVGVEPCSAGSGRVCEYPDTGKKMDFGDVFANLVHLEVVSARRRR